MSNLINKVKEAVSSDKSSHGHATHGTHTTTGAGTTATDPLTGTTAPGHTSTTTGATGATAPLHGSHDPALGHNTAAGAGTAGPASRTDGPHSSNLLNKADPRVDSDRDHSRNMGANPHGTATTGTHTGTGGSAIPTTGHTGTRSTTTGHTGTHSTTTGTTPHSSHLANVADPRVNTSSQHQTATHGTTTGHTPMTGHTGTTGHSTTTTHGIAGSTGPAANTAGPHKSDLLNRADPRVDSNLDGSKTVGGDKTFAQSGETTGTAHKDPTDAAQVPPSVLKKHVGDPSVEHDDIQHAREQRHSISHQEQHRGL